MAKKRSRVGRELAARAGARATLLTVLPGPEASLRPEVDVLQPRVAFGLPAIEIPRAGRALGADLIVLGRTPRPGRGPADPGPTAEAVLRRSESPCLFVPLSQAADGPARVLLALDGTPRGQAVLTAAPGIASLLAGALEVLHVERDRALTGGHSPAAGRVREAADRMAAEAGIPLPVRALHGEPAACLAAESAREPGRTVLVLGFRRGTERGDSQSSGVGRRLLSLLPCAVLTVPL